MSGYILYLAFVFASRLMTLKQRTKTREKNTNTQRENKSYSIVRNWNCESHTILSRNRKWSPGLVLNTKIKRILKRHNPSGADHHSHSISISIALALYIYAPMNDSDNNNLLHLYVMHVYCVSIAAAPPTSSTIKNLSFEKPPNYYFSM